MPAMSLNIIPFVDVQAALEVAEAADQETDKFNTHFHTHAEIAAIIPEPEGNSHKHVYPDLTASHFSRWIDLIASSQGFPEWHEIILSISLVQELLDANAIWALTGKAISDDAMEDLLARFPKRTSQAVETQTVFDGEKEWFLRLDFCSTKDARGEGGKKYASSIRTIEDALQRISASKRAIRALEDILLKKAPGPARLFFVPHNEHMDTSREFRVFCPPVWTLSALSNKRHGRATQSRSNDREPSLGRITAISQYRWHSPYHRPSLAAAQTDAAKVLACGNSIYAQILAYAAKLPDAGVLQRLRTEGFVFDIFEASSGEMQLLEINPFGAMSGCGSCLFHWIADAPLLYGIYEDVEVRLTM
jgi:hypothetical protein